MPTVLNCKWRSTTQKLTIKCKFFHGQKFHKILQLFFFLVQSFGLTIHEGKNLRRKQEKSADVMSSNNKILKKSNFKAQSTIIQSIELPSYSNISVIIF